MKRNLRKKIETVIRRLRVRRCPVPFMIWFRERSGSTHLSRMLDMHPEIICLAEDFHEQIIADEQTTNYPSEQLYRDGAHVYVRQVSQFDRPPIVHPTSTEVVAHLHDIFSCPAKACGFKFKHRIQNVLFPEIIPELGTFGDELRLIVLSRQNVLKQAISKQNMRRLIETGAAPKNHANLIVSDDPQGPPDHKAPAASSLHLDVDAAIRYARQLQRETIDFENTIQRLSRYGIARILRVNYEEMLSDESTFLERVFTWLEVDPAVKVQAFTRKATPNDLTRAIENYDELARAVAGTDLEPMLV
ncbi:MAG: sulfotransferase [Mariniblastus sp.]|nr:sulfotransferase [Mariniblastus sp.]